MTYAVSLRRKVLAHIEEGMGKREAARLFKISPNTIYEWLGRGDDLSPRPAKTRKRTLDKAALERHVLDNPSALLRECADHFNVGVITVCSHAVVGKTALVNVHNRAALGLISFNLLLGNMPSRG